MKENENALLVQNEKEANLFVAKAMRVCVVLFTLILGLNFVGIFVIQTKAMVTAYIVGVMFLLLPTLLVNGLKIYHPMLKYLFVTIAVIFVSVLIVTLNWHVIVMFIFAIAVANMYFSKKLNLYAMGLSIVMYSISQYVAYLMQLTIDHNQDTAYDVAIYCIVPRALCLMAISSLFLALNNRTSKLLANLLDADSQAKMMAQMKLMQDKSSEVSEILSESVDTLSGVTQSNSINNKYISDKAEQAAGASKQTLLEIEDVKTNVVNISDNLTKLAEGTDEIAQLSHEVKNLTEENTQQMIDATDGFEKISSSTEKSLQVIYELENKSKEIASITNVITSISSQTNLLALNASIESARAGEAGRGFAVVAEEIRELAEQTKTAVENISQIVEQVTANTMEAVKTMDESNQFVMQGMDIIKAARTSSNHVTAASVEMNGKIGEIDLLTKNVAQFAEKIVAIVENVKEISTESLKELESVSEKSSQEVTDMQQLEDLVVQIGSMAEQLNVMVHGQAEVE